MEPQELTNAVQRAMRRAGHGYLSVHTQYALNDTYCVCTVIVDRKDKELTRLVVDVLGHRFGYQQVRRFDDGKVVVRLLSSLRL